MIYKGSVTNDRLVFCTYWLLLI